MKEIKQDINKWNPILHSWIEIFNIVKILTPTKEIYRFKATPIKTPMMPINCTIIIHQKKQMYN